MSRVGQQDNFSDLVLPARFAARFWQETRFLGKIFQKMGIRLEHVKMTEIYRKSCEVDKITPGIDFLDQFMFKIKSLVSLGLFHHKFRPLKHNVRELGRVLASKIDKILAGKILTRWKITSCLVLFLFL